MPVRAVVEQLESRVFLAANAIVTENLLPGTPQSEWDVSGAGDLSIQGFATDISVNHGQTVSFKIDDQSRVAYQVDIYRMGYYGGLGARLVATMQSTAAHQIAQPAGLSDPTTGELDCGNWSVTDSWAVPANATSGIYFAQVWRRDTGGASHIFFIVRNDGGHSDMLFQTSDATWQAYNTYGGKSLYDYQSPTGKAVKVSYNRPFLDRNTDAINSFVFTNEYPMVRWMERNGYDVSYFTNVDTARSGGEILQHKVFLSVGHDEYWSGEMRANVQAARDAGVNLAFFSGNEMFWKTRWENSIDGSGTAYRTLVCYKESEQSAKTDPLPNVWTGTWRDPRFSPPADGGRPENGLTGTLFMVNSTRSDPINISAEDGKIRFWRNTSIATLAAGQTATLPAGVLGYEWDEDLDNGFRPAGLIDMSHTTIAVDRLLISEDTTYGPGVATHSLTMYRAPSGAIVFGAGTIQWSWGLDANHDRAGTAVDVRMQQATVNLFADMGAQPGSLQTNLLPAAASTDHTAPTSVITSPLNGATVNRGDTITITGTATDAGGGVVAGVEVSVDGGLTWHPATGRTGWQYVWQAGSSGTIHVLSRATDDSVNMETPGAGVTVTVPGSATPISVWNDTVSPSSPSGVADAQTISSGGVELGMKFRSDTAGQILGVRFYKGVGSSGAHTGALWSSAGQLLATATFINETTSGWQQVYFSTPVTIQAGLTYIVSYHTTQDHWVRDMDYFATNSPISAPLHALLDGVDGGNGVYRYGTGGVMPTSTYRSANYWADVLFTQQVVPDTTPPTVSSQSPAAGAVNVAQSAAIVVGFSEAINPATALLSVRDGNGTSVAGTVSYNSSTFVLTFQPGAALAGSTAYTVTVSGAADLAGNVMAGSVSWSFTTVAPDTTPPTVTSQSPAAGAANVAQSTAITVGFSEAINPATAVLSVRDGNGTSVAGTLSYNSSTFVLTFQPGAALAASTAYTVTVSGAADLAGNVMAGTVSWGFTTAAAVVTPISVWSNATVATGTAVTDANTISSGGIELGMKFRSSVAGQVLGVKYYKGTNNTGVHTGSLWSSTGQLLATVTFSNGTASGWQTALFSSPVTIQAGVTYIVSYHTTKDRWLRSQNYFSSAGVVNGPLQALRNGVDGGNGVFVYGSGNTVPATSSASANYWVDVLFTAQVAPDTTPPTVSSQSPAAGAANVAQSAAIAVGFSEAINPATAVLSVRDGNGTSVAGTVSYNTSTFVLTFQPGAALAGSTTYTVTVSGTADLAGNVMAGSVSWSFTTVAPDTTPPTVSSQSPAAGTANVAQSAAITVGFSEAINPATALLSLRDGNGTSVAGTLSYNSSTFVLTFQPSAALAASTVYTMTVSGAADLAGNVMAGTVSWGFTTAAVVVTPLSVWSSTASPTSTTGVVDSQTISSGGVELGMKFRSSVAGQVLGVKFYKGSGNTGVHTGSLWSSTGQLLATVTFSNETASGWQTALFGSPVTIQAGVTYIVSYHTTTDRWISDRSAFAASGVSSGPLQALQNGVDGGNGVYMYGSGNVAPTNSYLSSNYWVDVLFVPA